MLTAFARLFVLNRRRAGGSLVELKEYHRVADYTLDYLCGEFESLGETQDNNPHYDVEYSVGVLKVSLGPSYGTLVLNKQPPNRQLWLSSPISGPKRFDWQSDKWFYARENLILEDLLNEELKPFLPLINLKINTPPPVESKK